MHDSYHPEAPEAEGKLEDACRGVREDQALLIPKIAPVNSETPTTELPQRP